MPFLITRKGMILNLERALDTLMGYRVIFYGEDHDSPAAHDVELALLTGLAGRDPRLVVALEMFERDVQDALDAYLGGRIPEDTFLERSRPWPNYPEDYRPLVELAKARALPVIAANVPRRAAAAVARAGEISPEVLGEDCVYLPEKLHFDSEEYHERFTSLLGEMPAMGPMKSLNTEALYRAQILKDAVMAESLEPFLDRRILFICGRFHSDYRLGIPYQLRKNHPEVDAAVVVGADAVAGLPMKDRSRIADFIWVPETDPSCRQ